MNQSIYLLYKNEAKHEKVHYLRRDPAQLKAFR